MADTSMIEGYTSGAIRFTGLGGGADFNALIDAMVETEYRRIDRLEEWRQSWDDKVAAFQELNTKMLTLKSHLEEMNSLGEFLVKEAASTNSSVVTATTDSEAIEGSYSVDVTQLAQNEVRYSALSVADASSDPITGVDATFAYTYPSTGTATSVSVPANTTLNGLISLINSDPNNPGVRAELLKIGENDFRLKMVGLDQGVDNSITIDAATDIAALDATAGNWTISQTAQNALFSVDGISLTRDTNFIDDAVEGLTLNLVDAGAAKITVSTDTEGIKENVRAFVENVNELRTYIKEISNVDDVNNQGSILTGNYGVDIIDRNLKLITSGKALGFDYYDAVAGTGDLYSNLSQIGIMTIAEEGNPDSGLLELDEEALDKALAKDPDGVAMLFSANFEGQTTTSDFTFASALPSSTVPDSYAVSYTVSGGSVTGATIGGYAANYDSATKQFTGASGTPVAGLAIQVNNFTDGNYSGQINLKHGKANELIGELKVLTGVEGPLHILEDNYEDIMNSIDKKIAYEEKRIIRMQRDLTNRFARVDAMLNYYNQLAVSLQNQAAGMTPAA